MMVDRNAANRHRKSIALKWLLSPEPFRVKVSVISINIRTGVMVPNVSMNRALNLLTYATRGIINVSVAFVTRLMTTWTTSDMLPHPLVML